MKKNENNYAFVDSQNLNLGVRSLGWKLDFDRFRRYLLEKYSVSTAYLFIGYVPQNQKLYSQLQKMGYVLVLKPTIPDINGDIKGNVDADLVLQAMIDYEKKEKIVFMDNLKSKLGLK